MRTRTPFASRSVTKFSGEPSRATDWTLKPTSTRAPLRSV
jgi:hypothetical protein